MWPLRDIANDGLAGIQAEPGYALLQFSIIKDLALAKDSRRSTNKRAVADKATLPLYTATCIDDAGLSNHTPQRRQYRHAGIDQGLNGQKCGINHIDSAQKIRIIGIPTFMKSVNL